MKKIFSLIIVSMMLVLMFVPVHAADGDILKGTPEIDGELDEIYLQSVSYELGNFNFHQWENFETSVTAKAYFLWDENYLYVCSVVNDKTISSAGQAYIDANQPNPWKNDAVENWFLDNGTKIKIHNDAYGLTMFSSPVECTFDISKAVYKTSISGDTYIVETAMPFADMKVGREIGFAMQVNDIPENDNTVGGSASGTQTPDQTTYVCVATEVDYPVVEEIVVEAPVEAAAPVETAAPAPAKSPQTSDNALVSAIVLVMSAAAVIAYKKRSSK